MQAKELMSSTPATCAPDTPIEELARRFADGEADYALVVDDDGRLLGIVTEADLVDRERRLHLPTAIAVFDMVIPLGEKRFEEELARLRATTAADLMSAPVRTASPEAPIEEVAELFAEEGVRHLPIVEDGVLVGVVTQHDLVRALARRR